MLALRDVLAMRAPLRLATIATIGSLLFAQPSLQQTFSSCNPTQGTCPADPALGKSIAVDFTSGGSDQFTAQGAPTYDSNGAAFTVAKSGDAPTLVSKWYIMFGRVEVTMKAAPGAGIVSSSVLQSDDLDEIDWEWLGAQPSQVQSNYFGKGQTTSYDRAAVHAVSDTTGDFHKYTVDWTDEQIVWQIDGKTVRVLNSGDAHGQYPQTPMQFKIGAWSGGDSSNAEGTIAWSQGPTDYSAGPFTMYVKSVSVTDYSTGTQYAYGDTSGGWQSIESTGGKVNGNSGGSPVDTAAPAITSTSSGTGPWSGGHDCSTCSTPGVGSWSPTTMQTATLKSTNLPGLQSGWSVDPQTGKVVPPSAAPSTSRSLLSMPSPRVSAAACGSGAGYSIVTSYNEQGFLTTATVPDGIKTSFDNKGFPTTIYPSNCQVSNPPFAFVAGAVLHATPVEAQQTSSSDTQSKTTGSNGVLLSTNPSTSLVGASSPSGSASKSDDDSSDAGRNGARWLAACSSLVGVLLTTCFFA